MQSAGFRWFGNAIRLPHHSFRVSTIKACDGKYGSRCGLGRHNKLLHQLQMDLSGNGKNEEEHLLALSPGVDRFDTAQHFRYGLCRFAMHEVVSKRADGGDYL